MNMGTQMDPPNRICTCAERQKRQSYGSQTGPSFYTELTVPVCTVFYLFTKAKYNFVKYFCRTVMIYKVMIQVVKGEDHKDENVLFRFV